MLQGRVSFFARNRGTTLVRIPSLTLPEGEGTEHDVRSSPSLREGVRGMGLEYLVQSYDGHARSNLLCLHCGRHFSREQRGDWSLVAVWGNNITI